MIVSIGILAYNEALRIGETLRSLLAQSAFGVRDEEAGVREWEVVVVPNGCTDATVEVAERTWAASARPSAPVRQIVSVLAKGDKSSAWNHFVHGVSRVDADILVLVDADIEFGSDDTLLNCLKLLRSDAYADVAVDTPLKRVARKTNPNWRERLSLRQSRLALSDDVAICGQFYCARAVCLRKIWMPPGLSVEDGYLRALVVTDCFRREADVRRVVRAPNALHYYDGLDNIKALIHHETRIVIGTALNCYLTWDFLRFATRADGLGAGDLVRSQLASDPDWYRALMENQVRTRGRWVLPSGMLFRRFETLRGQGWQVALRRLPVSIIGS